MSVFNKAWNEMGTGEHLLVVPPVRRDRCRTHRSNGFSVESSLGMRLRKQGFELGAPAALTG